MREIAQQPIPRRRSCLAPIVVVLILVGALMAYIEFSMHTLRMANHVKCGNNLRALGQAMMLYANEQSDGSFPPAFGRLLATQDLAPAILICPSSKDAPVQGKSLEELEANLLKGSHVSYVYTGKGLNWKCGPAYVLAYESAGNHKDGSHVLYGDGHVDFLPVVTAAKIVAELNAGFNPPRAEKIK